jgi:hypothetical protein
VVVLAYASDNRHPDEEETATMSKRVYLKGPAESLAPVDEELERSILKERIMAGIARARDNGTKSGKPIGRPRVPPSVEAAIAKALQQGKHGIHKIAAKHSVGVGVVQRIKAAL